MHPGRRCFLVVLTVAAVSCARADEGRVTGPTSSPPASTPSPFPAGWIPIEPTEEMIRCANHSAYEWNVAVEKGALTITEVTASQDRWRGPALPFSVPRTPENLVFRNSFRNVLAVDDGFLVGLDDGEWGGGLYAFSADGQQRTKLASENVRGLVALGDQVVSLEGYSGMMIQRGILRWLRHDRGTWREVAVVTLDSTPRTFFATGDTLYILTHRSLVRVGPDRDVKTIQPFHVLDGIGVDSMTIDAEGRLWVGLRHFVMRLEPRGDQYGNETLLVRQGCQSTVFDEASYQCLCTGAKV